MDDWLKLQTRLASLGRDLRRVSKSSTKPVMWRAVGDARRLVEDLEHEIDNIAALAKETESKHVTIGQLQHELMAARDVIEGMQDDIDAMRATMKLTNEAAKHLGEAGLEALLNIVIVLQSGVPLHKEPSEPPEPRKGA